MARALLLALLLAFVVSTVASARTWYVRQDGTGDTSAIPQGMGMASYGDTVLVGPGIYGESAFEHQRVALVFLKDGVVLISEQGPQVTILDGAAVGSDPRSLAAVEFVSVHHCEIKVGPSCGHEA